MASSGLGFRVEGFKIRSSGMFRAWALGLYYSTIGIITNLIKSTCQNT